MTRGRTPAQVAADMAGHQGGVLLLEFYFDSGLLPLAVGGSSITVGATTYQATGAALLVRDVDEAADGVEGAEFVMSGIDPAIFTLAVNEPYRDRLARMLELRYDASHQPVGDPVVQYVGRMKRLSSDENPADRTHTITLTTEHYDAVATRPVQILFSHAEQQRRFPGDLGLEYVAALVDRTIARKPKTR